MELEVHRDTDGLPRPSPVTLRSGHHTLYPLEDSTDVSKLSPGHHHHHLRAQNCSDPCLGWLRIPEDEGCCGRLRLAKFLWAVVPSSGFPISL